MLKDRNRIEIPLLIGDESSEKDSFPAYIDSFSDGFFPKDEFVRMNEGHIFTVFLIFVYEVAGGDQNPTAGLGLLPKDKLIPCGFG